MTPLFPAFAHEASIAFEDVSLSRGSHHLFGGLSLTLSPGETLYIQGVNGIGKTSLLRLAAGFSKPEAGSVDWLHAHHHCRPADVVAYQGHVDAFKPALTAMEELTFWADIYDYDGPLGNVFSAVNLEDRHELTTNKLSAGQKRRLALARLIISGKPIWIMDEPKAAMDEAGSALIEAIIQYHTVRGGSVMLASHAPAKSLSGQTRRLVLDNAA